MSGPVSSSSHLAWNAEALWESLQSLEPGISVEVLARADSTNTMLIERARRSSGQHDAPVSRPGAFDPMDTRGTPHGRRAGDTQACLLVAETQTRGRGRMGRTWQSSGRASLTFSLALPLSPQDWSGLSLAVGVALAEALDPADPATPASAPRLLLKWPNDLLLADAGVLAGGRKLGGVLIETVPVGQRRMCVVGVGLNIAPQPVDDLPGGFACCQEWEAAATAPAVLERVAAPLLKALHHFAQHGFAAFAAAYARRDALFGREVTTTQADAPQGLAEGVDERGALRLRLPDGELRAIVSGEVSVRPVATPGLAS